MSNKPKIGFCFSGEGARGAVQAGNALKLFDMGIKADFVTGISSGAANSFGYSTCGPKATADMWRNVKNIWSLFGLNWNFLWNTGLLNQKPMDNILSNMVHLSNQNNPYFCDGMVSTVNISTGEIVSTQLSKSYSLAFKYATLKAVAVPAMVTDRDGWVDAGCRVMTPLNSCITEGCDEIYIILGRPLQFPVMAKAKGLLAFAGMAYRAVDITLFEILLRDIKDCLEKNQLAIAGSAFGMESKYREIQVRLVEVPTLFCDSVQFASCANGVDYGYNNCVISDGDDKLLERIRSI